MKSIRNAFGFKDPFMKLCNLLEKDIEELNKNTTMKLWAQFESRLYLMYYLATDLQPNEVDLLADLMRVILKLPISVIKIKNTIIRLIEKGAGFLAKM